MLGCVKSVDYVGNDEDIWIVSDLVDEIQDTVINCQVSGIPEEFLWSPSLSLPMHQQATQNVKAGGPDAQNARNLTTA